LKEIFILFKEELNIGDQNSKKNPMGG